MTELTADAATVHQLVQLLEQDPTIGRVAAERRGDQLVIVVDRKETQK